MIVLTPTISRAAADVESSKLRAIADEIYAWRLEREPQMRLVRGLPTTRLPRIDYEAAREAAQFARAMQQRLAAIDAKALSHSDELFRQSLAHAMWVADDAERFYWLVFMVTPYQGGDIHQLVFRVLSTQQIATPADANAYLALVRDYGRILDEMREKTIEQRRRRILLPRAAIPGAIELCAQLRAAVPASLQLSNDRLAKLAPADAARVRKDLEQLVQSDILPRIERLQSVFDADYQSAAPQLVGLAQYPDGAAFYRHLIRAYTGLDLDPGQVHEIGTRALAEIDRQLDAIRTQVGYSGTREAFHASLKTDARWLARTAQEVEQRYMSFIRRIEPQLPKYFSRVPRAPYGVKRLDLAAEPGMTYGYYQSPGADDPSGYYRYNGSGLDKRTLAGAQHLIYHELVPGHHFQRARELEQVDAHPLRAFLGSTAYMEGWAEYAAALAEEMQLYEPLDNYGHLMMRSFIATRLVVDTGLNAQGWTLERARDAMRRGTLESDAQIGTELLRYSTDIPAQALSYYLGYDHIRKLRARAQEELGAAFDVRAFNDAILATGPVPLNVMDSHIDWFIREAKASRTSAQHIAASHVVNVRIERPASDVWAALFDRSGWMPSFVSKQHLRGPKDAAGEQSLYNLRDAAGSSGQRLEEILLAIPGERLVIRLGPPDGHGTSAVGEYRLTKRGRTTDLEFNVYWWEDISEPSTPEQLQMLEDSYVKQTDAKIRADIERLKRHLEAAR